MDNVATASINSFGNSPKADVLPSEDPIFVLTASQIRDLITSAVKEAIQLLQDEVMELKATVASQQEEMAAMSRKLASLETLQEQDTTRICLDIAYDRRRLAALEHVEPQPMQRDRGEILRALIAANGGKMLAKDARQKMHLTKNRFSELLKVCNFIETKPLHSDKRRDIIILKSGLVPRN
jgi:FtsZ-binding cell division protein ZapB